MSKEPGPFVVGLLEELLSKLGCKQGGNSWDGCLRNSVLHDYMLTPRGQRGEGH